MKTRSLVLVMAPVAVPVIVIVYVPAMRVLVPFRVTVLLLPGITGLGENDTVVPAGLPAAVKLIGLENPPVEIVPRLTDILVPAGQGETAGAGVENSKPVGGGVSEKLLLDISKKIFPMASIFTLAELVIIFGNASNSEPSLAVLADKIVG